MTESLQLKALKDLENIDKKEIDSGRRRFLQAGDGGLHVASRHPGIDDGPEGHGAVAYFTLWKEGLKAE